MAEYNEVVKRIIEQWEALKLYFTSTYLTDRLVATQMIYQGPKNPFMKLLLFSGLDFSKIY